MSESGSFIVATAERVFADLADPSAILRSRSRGWRDAAWAALQETGLTFIWVPEIYGGAEVPFEEGFEVLRAAGRAALALPLAETMLGSWLLSRAAIAPPSGSISIGPVRPTDKLRVGSDGRLSGRLTRVPFARDVDHLVLLVQSDEASQVALVRRSDCRIEHSENLAGEPSDLVDCGGVLPLALEVAPQGMGEAELLTIGAVVRTQQIAGALEKMLDLSVRYATERVAFERPIGKFQAVQHSLARFGGEVAAAVAAAGSAADTIVRDLTASDSCLLEVAAAKIRCGEAAEVGAAIAHQVHGAIGFTDEHVLHMYTLRAMGWRDDFGSEVFWSGKLGSLVSRIGARGLWPLLASR
ncbi:acyl-CoA dehydrogenase family protein [Bradyrhizobium sp. HKCCYLS20291]|uniref:acyl-CoA dehydrogenase family protein n=1 Tax=Bradyrhizobium sp. HKCCYLS20291 TaxID=3420766 RepID=UPI003EC06B14